MKKQDHKPEMFLLVDGNRGIYVAQSFYQNYRQHIVTKEPIPTWVLNGIQSPDEEDYSEAMLWFEDEDNAILQFEDGKYYPCWNDGNLWAIPEGYSWEDDFEE